MKTILAIDVGTTAIKFNLFELSKFEILAEAKRVIPLEDKDGYQVQNPKIILELVLSGIKEITKLHEVTELVLSTAMHSLIPVVDDKIGEVYLWSDMRAYQEIANFKKNEPELAKSFYEKTGTPIHEMSPFAKLLHFKQQNLIFFESVTKWIGLKEYLMLSLTGELVVDYSVASATGVFNSLDLKWDEEILTYLSLKDEQFARTVDTDTSYPIVERHCSELKLKQGTRVFIGASDGVLASYATYIGTNSKTSLTMGTSGAVRYLSDTRQLSDKQTTFCYYLSSSKWVVGGATNNGGRTLEWASELFYEDKYEIFSKLPTLLSSTPIGAKNLVFLPYINGERAPLWDGDHKGTFEGVALFHRRNDFIRAICEGILYNLKVIYKDLDLSTKNTIGLSGGLFNVDIIARECAAIFGETCIKSLYNEPSFGAVCLCEKDAAQFMREEQELIKYDNEAMLAHQISFNSFSNILEKSLRI